MSELKIPYDWTFENSDVARGFDQHVREQLPWYDLATGAVAHIIRHYLPQDGILYDIGTSTGNIPKAIAEIVKTRNALVIPVEASEEMATCYSGPGKENMIIGDITQCIDDIGPFDVAVFFLTLMFIPVRERDELLRAMRDKMQPGGVIIILDKVLPKGGYLGTVLSRMTLAGKVASGVPAGEIVAKELSLMGVQRALSPEGKTGWKEWFRFGEFVGWVIEAEEG